MAFNQAFQNRLIFADRYGRTGRSYQAINFFRDLSAANTTVQLTNESFVSEDGGAGKLRKVRLVYFPISCDEGGSCADNVCDAGTVVQPKSIEFAVQMCTSSQVFRINGSDLRYIDNTKWDANGVAINTMLSYLPAFRRKLAKEMIQKAYGLAGTHADGNQTHRVVNIAAATGRVNPMGKIRMDQEYTDLGYTEPYTLGGGDFFDVMRLEQIGGLNDDGVNINRAGFNNMYYDDALQGELFNDLVNGNWALTITPETFKMITFSRNAGIFRTGLASIDDLQTLKYDIRPGYIRGTYIDRETGLMYDFDAKYFDCDDYWQFQWRLEWDFFAMPDVVCNDTAAPVNGWMKWRTCPQVDAVCPTGVSPSTPVAADTYSWTPVLADIPTIYNSVISGYGSGELVEPVAITTLAQLAAYMTNNSNYAFTVNGSAIEYTGTTAIEASFNNAAVEATFA